MFKTITISLSFLSLAIISNGQIKYDQQVKQFLNEFVKNDLTLMKSLKDSNLYYHEKIDSSFIQELVANVSYSENFHNMQNEIVPFVLSKEEKERVKTMLLAQKKQIKDSDIIDGAKIFKLTTLPRTYNDYETIPRKDLISYNAQFKGKYIINFSMPIFIRNNSICIFSFISADEGGVLYIMLNIKGIWVKFLSKTFIYI